ncbi:histidinol dehydrogenase [Crocosphaera subtropica ATCC 51142]|uniref:Histidinol dehydrogenase n=1 Tax=Crocosphaera subtropica (strain ATCC 51142 / BH68) TaxID=43989 RepID=B1WUL4_CROS5|nr:histidinol dehydrogenase [Crocosphaera subtropica]ACB53868.1 histidinol dehydrogenase [Crocosphaera subtropica ATCC 51142]
MLRIITQSAEINTELQRIRDRPYRDEIQAKEVAVGEILERIKHQGDQGLFEPFDILTTPTNLKVSGSDLDAAYQKIPKELLDAIQTVSQKLESFYKQQLPKPWVKFEDDDVVVGKRYTPVKRAGIYVAWDQGSPISRVLMQTLPAKMAKVPEIILVTPPDETGKVPPDILVAAQVSGVNQIYRIGGAKAIAALAHGTETIPKVEVITGTGGLDVILAKRMVYGTVTTDTPVDASELFIIADRTANPAYVAADLLAQVEQDPSSAVIVLTTDFSLAQKIQTKVQEKLQDNAHGILSEKAIAHYSLIIIVESLEQAVNITNEFAPHYGMLALTEPWDIIEKIRAVGSLFIGHNTPKAVGDYLGTGSVILPPSGLIRYASSVRVETFLKPSHLIEYAPTALKKLANALEILALAEGLPGTADAINLRLVEGEDY